MEKTEAVRIRKTDKERDELVYSPKNMVPNKMYSFELNGSHLALMKDNKNEIGLYEFKPTDPNAAAFSDFKKYNIKNPVYSGKFVSFVNGSMYSYGTNKPDVAKSVHSKFGDVKMYIGSMEPDYSVHIAKLLKSSNGR